MVKASQPGGGLSSVNDSDVTFTDITTGNASTTKHGFLKKLSGVATEFMNGLGNWATISGGATVISIMPRPVYTSIGANATILSVNTVASVGLLVLEHTIVVNKLTIDVTAVVVAGTLDICIYSEDGQTKLLDITTASISTTGTKTTAVGAINLPAGNYYIYVGSNGTANVTVSCYAGSIGMISAVASEPKYSGTLTVTAGTPPATFDPAALTSFDQQTLIIRLDT